MKASASVQRRPSKPRLPEKARVSGTPILASEDAATTANRPQVGAPEQVLSVVFGCAALDVAENVILTPFVPLKAFQRHTPEGVRELAPPFFYSGFTTRFKGVPVTVIQTGVGPSRVGDCVSFLSLTPARRVLFAGAVGGLQVHHAVGDFFVPTEAADGEGYSRYRRDSFEQIARKAPVTPCSGGLEDELSAFLRARELPVREGRVFTVGSFAVESAENLETLRRLGYDALEMELSAFYAAAGHHAIQAAALTYVSDLPLEQPLWQAKTPVQEEALRRAYRSLPLLALEFLCHLPSCCSPACCRA